MMRCSLGGAEGLDLACSSLSSPVGKAPLGGGESSLAGRRARPRASSLPIAGSDRHGWPPVHRPISNLRPIEPQVVTCLSCSARVSRLDRPARNDRRIAGAEPPHPAATALTEVTDNSDPSRFVRQGDQRSRQTAGRSPTITAKTWLPPGGALRPTKPGGAVAWQSMTWPPPSRALRPVAMWKAVGLGGGSARRGIAGLEVVLADCCGRLSRCCGWGCRCAYRKGDQVFCLMRLVSSAIWL
jgi:hypothetical protein